LVVERHCEVARLLGDRVADWMLGDGGQEDLAALQVDKEPQVETAVRDCVDVEEVACQRPGGLSSKELSPCRS
jgi:hypothetical protein